MSEKNWSSIEVIQDPLRVIFKYESGDIKSVTAPKQASLAEIQQSEWDNIALASNGKTMNGRVPVLNRDETRAAMAAIREHGIHIA